MRARRSMFMTSIYLVCCTLEVSPLGHHKGFDFSSCFSIVFEGKQPKGRIYALHHSVCYHCKALLPAA